MPEDLTRSTGQLGTETGFVNQHQTGFVDQHQTGFVDQHQTGLRDQNQLQFGHLTVEDQFEEPAPLEGVLHQLQQG